MGGAPPQTLNKSPDGQLSTWCIKAQTALPLSLSRWFKKCMTQHLFPINREAARERWRKNKDKKSTGRKQTKIEDESIEKRDGKTDRQRRTERRKKRDKEISVERQRTFFSVNWRAR